MDQEASAVMVREGQYLNAGESVFTVYGNSGLVAEFSLDPGNASLIKKDQRILFSSLRNPNDSFVEIVDMIQPIFRDGDRKNTRLNSSHSCESRMPSTAC